MDAVLDELVDAVYGSGATADELLAVVSKSSPAGADLHVPGASADRRKKVAAAALGGTALATVGGLHALAGTKAEHTLRAQKVAEGTATVPKALSRLTPKQAAIAITGGWAALHGVELATDLTNAHTQAKEYRKAGGEQRAAQHRSKVAARAPADGPFVKVGEVSKANPFRAVQMAGQYADHTRRAATAAENAATASAHVPRLPNESRTEWAARRAHAQKLTDRGARRVGAYDTAMGAKSTAEQVLGHPHVQAAMAAFAESRKPVKQSFVRAHPIATGVGLGGGAVALSSQRRKSLGKSLVPVTVDPPADEHELEWVGEISKVDPDKRLVFGYCSLSKVDGKPVVDLQGDYIPIEEIEKSAYKYVVESRKGGDMHRRVSKFTGGDQPLHTADLVESFVITKEKLSKMGLPETALPEGWWVGFKVNDDQQWADVKALKRGGFSIHGSGVRKDLVVED